MSDDTQQPAPPAPAPSKPDTRNKRNAVQKAQDLAFIERLYVTGKRVPQIVEAIAKERPYTLSASQVKADLKRVEEEWKASAVMERDKAKRLELAGLSRQEAELWEAWDKSKTERTKQVFEQQASGTDVGGSTKKRLEKETNFGEPAYMRLILEVRAQRRALLGLDAPSKLEVTGEDGTPLIPDATTALELIYGRDDTAKAIGAIAPVRALDSLRN